MSSAANTQVDEFEDEAPGLWTSFATALRLIVGWFCLAIGVLNLLVEVDRNIGDPPDTAYFFFHVMLIVGGITLLAVSWLGRSPGLSGYLTGGLVLVAGMVVSGVPVSSSVCCMTAFDIRHGWPFTFVARDEGVGAAAGWHIDSQHLLADLLFWGYVGLIALVIVALIGRAGSPEPDPAGAEPASAPPTHAEHRALATEAVDDPAEPRPGAQ
ncbi:hypothetical protein [Actinoplanes sp. NPDC089786]|uniref:hypothetical protein n=1 Tax=Actinoplanes sp. NPDC089786 TaxID=3155185 RepID=UPI003426F602